MPKHPLGLSKSKSKKRAASPLSKESKKPKVDDEATKASLSDDWADLQELFARAFCTYVKGDVPSALPLLRGVLHECDRLWRNASQDDLLALGPLPPDDSPGSPPSHPTDSHHSFFALYLDALLHFALMIGSRPELATDDEPSPKEVVVAAGRIPQELVASGKQMSMDIRTTFTMANMSCLLTDVMDISQDEKLARQGDPIAQASRVSMPVSASTSTVAVNDCDDYEGKSATPSPPKAKAGDAPATEEERPARLPQLSRARVSAYLGTRLWDIVESWDNEENEKYKPQINQHFNDALTDLVLPEEDDAKYAALLGLARMYIYQASLYLPDDEEEPPSGKSKAAKAAAKLREQLLDEVRDNLENAVRRLGMAKEVAAECEGRSDMLIAINADDIKDYAEEALGYLIQYPKNAKEEKRWRDYAEKHGYSLGSSEEDESAEDEDEDEE